MQYYKVRDAEGTVIGQYQTKNPPEKPNEWTGEWNVETTAVDKLNDEPVKWWNERD